MNIVFCFDNNYALGYLVTMVSLFENNKDISIKVYIITPGLKEDNLRRFRYLAEYYHQTLVFKTIDDRIFDSFPTVNHLTKASYYRYCIPDLCPESKVLQLDGDIIVRKNLSDLWNTDVSDVAMGVVEDRSSEHRIYQNRLCIDTPIFNNGVQLMNLDYWRRNRVASQCMELLNSDPQKCTYMDQDANNIILQGKVRFLSYTYNFQTQWVEDLYGSWMHRDKLELIKQIANDPAIVHFITSKPWFLETRGVFKDEFEAYAKLHPIISYKPVRRIPVMYKIINKFMVMPSQWLARKFL